MHLGAILPSLLAVALVLAGCSDPDRRLQPEQVRNDTPGPAEASGLMVVSADGDEVTFEELDVTCEAVSYGPAVHRLIASAEQDDVTVHIEAAPVDAGTKGGRSWSLPTSLEDAGNGGLRIDVQIGDGAVASSVEERAEGEVRVLRASCDPVALEIVVDGTLSFPQDGTNDDDEVVFASGRVVAQSD